MVFRNFSELLEDNNMSVSDLSLQSGLTRQYCYNLLNGKYLPDSISYGVYTRLSAVVGEFPEDLWCILDQTYRAAHVKK